MRNVFYYLTFVRPVMVAALFMMAGMSPINAFISMLGFEFLDCLLLVLTRNQMREIFDDVDAYWGKSEW